MMHPVDAPEKRQLVGRPMLEPDGEIKHDKAGDSGQQERQAESGEKANSLALRMDRDAHRGHRKHHPEDGCVQGDNGEVRGPAPCLRHDERATWHKDLEHRHQDEHSEKEGQPGFRFTHMS